jgi:hypothetical protein
MSSLVQSNLTKLFEENPELNIPVNDYNINVTSNDGTVLDAAQLYQCVPRAILFI